MSASQAPSVSYAPGTWIGLVGSAGWMLVDLPIGDEKIAKCWTMLNDPVLAAGVLDVLVEDGLTRIPAFALVLPQDAEARVVARHPAAVTVDDDEGTRQITSGVGGTWTDVRVPLIDRRLTIGVVGDASSGIEVPIAIGVTQAKQMFVVHRELTGTPPVAVIPDLPVATGEPARAVRPDPPEPTTDFSFLLQATTDRDLMSEVTVTSPPSPPSPPSRDDGTDRTAVWVDGDVSPADDDSEDAPDAVDATAFEADPEPPAHAGSGIIDGLPWLTDKPSPAQPKAPPARPAMVRPPMPSVLPFQAARKPAASAAEVQEEVRTVSRSALLSAAVPTTGPTVLAVHCPRRHASLPDSATCRVCGEPVAAQEPVEIARPTLGVLRLSTGEVITLDRGVILGRAPKPPDGPTLDRPNCVKLLESPEISRSHVEVLLDDWHVLVRDLGSVNGTMLTLPGAAALQLREHETYALEPGSEVRLADVVNFRFEVTP